MPERTRGITVDCPAKINLGLEVTGRRADGYHDLVTIFQAVALADQLTILPATELELVCSQPHLITDSNLCLRAAHLLRAATRTVAGARLHLTKRVPEAAGLGGGSSDAAGTLVGLNALWRTGLGRQDLAALARQLGADVPFFLDGPTALAEGIGEVLTPLPPPPLTWLVLVTGDSTIEHKTARLYQSLVASDFTNGQRTREQADRLAAGAALATSLVTNAFTRALVTLLPAVADACRACRSAGAVAAFPTGSGPTLVALAHDETDAGALAARVSAAGYRTTRTHTLTAMPTMLFTDEPDTGQGQADRPGDLHAHRG